MSNLSQSARRAVTSALIAAEAYGDVAAVSREMEGDRRAFAMKWLGSFAAGTWQAEALARV
ncbi:hypothetical protein [Pleomorphomonas sp. PLEO]|uniref:hypothetical protein n=1 Tax=Pleomorphomonas sp. PLEO TaxID=3239306 RepID=UPI00351DE704